MMTLSRWKLWAVGLALVFGIVFSLPNLLPASVRASLPGFVPKQTLNLGLDLQGGVYLLYEVDTAALRKEKTTNLVEDVRSNLSDASIASTGLGVTSDGAVTVRISDPAQMDEAYKALQKLALPDSAGVQEVSLDRAADQRLKLSFSDSALRKQADDAVGQTINTIRRRIDLLGTKEPAITQQGSSRIVVQAPGEKNPDQLKKLIGTTAKMTFQLVDENASVEEALAGTLPPGSEVLPSTDKSTGPFVVVKKRALVTGAMLKKATGTIDTQTGQAVVAFSFKAVGAQKFGQATIANVGKRFAIILDGNVISAPSINEPILGGNGQISGNFTVQSADELATLLNGGALPAPLKLMSEQSVGPEMGDEAIRAGKISVALGLVAIVAFIFLAYGALFGGVAIASLILNLLMMFGVLSMTQSTLTLPGIAGLVLTLAVAVDASVLIYERIRDEERAGRTPIAAMDTGFSRALVSIFDANITSLIAALILFSVGAGPVRGFAVTLSFGVFTSVFSAILVTQVLLGLWLRMTRPKKLPI
ncbi:preprotein translocase subunit SecD [Caulobacter ginsengisoli]|uniref:Protein translocase subunit SecD n=1 Tax=Caulobacter ginsengisoli TaxID=400775 RepID=A0ABU0IS95_9CAUL|nr:protein translocase subunit SecD [Caulobacter ginsengisoli]MDQ0463817.1 preprotein translocase subunit SecD [Caulobacter ginsengisoli]